MRGEPIHGPSLFGFPLAPHGARGPGACAPVATAGENAVRAGRSWGLRLWRVDGDRGVHGGAGWPLAHSFTIADAGMTATRACSCRHDPSVRAHDPAGGRIRPRRVDLSICLGCVRRKVLPRWARYGRFGGWRDPMALAVAFPETTKADQAAFVLPVLWQWDGQCHAPAAWTRGEAATRHLPLKRQIAVSVLTHAESRVYPRTRDDGLRRSAPWMRTMRPGPAVRRVGSA